MPPMKQHTVCRLCSACCPVIVDIEDGKLKGRYEEKEKRLKELIRQRGLKIVGEPVFARYNPPFMPWFLRRNEVLIPVTN
jgi:Fe-S oxidoreductase